MAKFTLAEAIGNVDDKQIARALKFGRRANKLLRIAPLAACLMPAVLIVPIVRNGSDTRPPIDVSTDSGDPNDSNDKNPGGATSRDPSKMEYNGEFFQFDHCVIRIVYDENNRIIDPVKADWDDFTRDTLSAADSLDELEFIGMGNVIGADPEAKLYMMPGGNILAVRPCVLEPYADAEEMLAKYPADLIFEIFTFKKIDPSANEFGAGTDNDNRNP